MTQNPQTTPQILYNFRQFTKPTGRFQTEATEVSGQDPNRAYFEGLVAQTNEPNDQGYIFMPEAMPGMRDAYQAGQQILVKHWDLGISGASFGKTVDAEATDDELHVQFYVMRNKDTPNGPYGNTNQLIDAIMDGAMAELSVGAELTDVRCSICKNAYRDLESGCTHWKGQTYTVKNEVGQDIQELCIVQIYGATPFELSIVGDGSDPNAVVKREIMLSSVKESLMDYKKRDLLAQFNSKKEENQVNDKDIAAQKAELDARAAALTERENAQFKADLEARDARIAKLESEIAENKQMAADGKTAREQAIKANREAYTKAHPDATAEVLSAKFETRTFDLRSLEEINADTQIWLEAAAAKYGDGNGSVLQKKMEEATHSDKNKDILPPFV